MARQESEDQAASETSLARDFFLQISLEDFCKHENTTVEVAENHQILHRFLEATGCGTKERVRGGTIPFKSIASLCLATPCPSSDPKLGANVAIQVVRIAEDILRKLQQSQRNSNGCPDPRQEMKLFQDLRMCFYVLCHLAMSTSKLGNGLNAPHSGGDRVAKSSKAVLVAAWQLHSVILPNIIHTEDFFSLSTSILGVSEVNAASSLLQVVMLGVLEYPLPTVPGGAVKEATERVHQTAAGYLIKILSPATPAQEHTAVCVLESVAAMLEVSRGPPKEVLYAFNHLLQSTPRAGSSVVAALVQRIGGTAAQEGQRTAPTIKGAAPDHLASFLSMLATSNGGQPAARACFFASFKEILSLLGYTRPGVRRPILDLVAALTLQPVEPSSVQNPSSSPSALSLIGASTILAIASNDKDATLRARALGIIETHAPAMVHALGSLEDRAQILASCIAIGLCDRAGTVRKRAGLLLAALRELPAPEALQRVLKATVAPVVTSLLKVPKDSAFYPGEATTQLTTCLIAMIKPSAGSPAATLSCVRLHQMATEDAARAVIEKALALTLLPADCATNDIYTTPLLNLLKECSRRDVEQARIALQGAMSGALMQGRAARLVAALMGSLGIGSTDVSPSFYSTENLLPVLQALFVLGSSSNTTPTGMLSPPAMCAHLLPLIKAIASSLPADGTACETLHWALQCATTALKQFKGSDWNFSIAPLVLDALKAVAAAPWASSELPSAARMLLFLPSPRQAFEYVASTLADEAMAESPQTSHRGAALMQILGVMSELYLVEKEDFKKTLDAGGDAAEGARAAEFGAGAGEASESSGDGCAYLRGEEHAQRVEMACQAFIERVMENQRSAPACFIPWLLSAASCQSPNALQALQPMAMMYYNLCSLCMPLALSQAMDANADTEARIAALNFLAAAIDTYPTAYSNHLRTLTSVLGQGPSSIEPRVAAVAVSAFAELSLSNKLKGSDVLASVGVVVSSADGNISSVGFEVMRRLMDSASHADRAMLFMGVVHQIPRQGPDRKAVVLAALELLNDADKKHDGLVAPALALALEASTDDAAGAAAALLHQLHPSAKILRSLQVSLLGATLAGSLHESIRQELVRFVQRCLHEGKENEEPDGVVEGNAGGSKRSRQVGNGKKKTADLQSEILHLLQTGGQRRPTRQ